jgi:hypothetical protein
MILAMIAVGALAKAEITHSYAVVETVAGKKLCEFQVNGGAKFQLDEDELRSKISEGETVLKVMTPPPQMYIEMIRNQKNCLAELTGKSE